MTAQLVSGPLPGDLHGAIVGDLMAYMGRRRISQRRLAAALDVEQSTVSRWFNKGMTVADLDRVLAALGLSGRLTLVDAETGQVTVAKIRRNLRPVPGSGHASRTLNRPLMSSVSAPFQPV